MIKRYCQIILILFVCFAISNGQTEIPLIQADTISYIGENINDISQMCSLECAIGRKTSASSFLLSKKKKTYAPYNVSDGKLKTVWIDGGNKNGIGETITYSFPRSYFVYSHLKDTVNFDGVRVFNGYINDSITWKEYSRVKKFRVFHNAIPTVDIELADCPIMQEAESKELFYLKPNDKIVVKILEIYPGSKFKHVALTELIPLGAH